MTNYAWLGFSCYLIYTLVRVLNLRPVACADVARAYSQAFANNVRVFPRISGWGSGGGIAGTTQQRRNAARLIELP